MKSLLMRWTWVAAAALLAGTAWAVGKDESISAADQVKTMGRGVNILGYDPMWRDLARARFQLRHTQVIREGGFSTVRINLQAFEHLDSAGHLSAQWLDTLQRVVNSALAQDLVILDEHDYNLCGKDPDSCRPKLLAFWEEIAERYKNAPDKVLFEILNEPNRGLNSGWNDLLAEALGVIRRSNPTRNVVIGPDHWNNVHELEHLRLPEQDRHIIVTVHYYVPMEFTHQGAPWEPSAKKLGVTWGSKDERARLKADFDGVAHWSSSHDRPILLGEFGAYDKAPLESRIAYTSAVAREAEAHQWAWTYWQFDSDFVVYRIDQDAWNEPIYRALIP
jgi:endoglucanase